MKKVSAKHQELQLLLLESMTHELGNIATSAALARARAVAGADPAALQGVLDALAAALMDLVTAQRAAVNGNQFGWRGAVTLLRGDAWWSLYGKALGAIVNPGSQISFSGADSAIPTTIAASMTTLTGACICQIERRARMRFASVMHVSLARQQDNDAILVFRFTARRRSTDDLRAGLSTIGPWMTLARDVCRQLAAEPSVTIEHGELAFTVNITAPVDASAPEQGL